MVFVEEQDGEVVCVTGSWEMLGTRIVQLLLKRGYSVRCGIRMNTDEVAELMSLPGAEQRLQMVQVDVLNHKSLEKTIRGCVGVVHTPAPHDMNGLKEYPADMIEYEVKGTLNVVEACANSESVRRLVLTSCLSTIVFVGGGKDQTGALDERSWTNLDFCRANKLWSPLSKTLAERAAWALAIDKGLDMVVLNPATVLPNNDVQGLRELHKDEVFAYVLAEDVAQAHVAALEKPNARGRYMCFRNVLTGPDVKQSQDQVLSNKKLQSLGKAI